MLFGAHLRTDNSGNQNGTLHVQGKALTFCAVILTSPNISFNGENESYVPYTIPSILFVTQLQNCKNVY